MQSNLSLNAYTGVGQSEFAVADMVDMFVLLIPPAGGDELQVYTFPVLDHCCHKTGVESMESIPKSIFSIGIFNWNWSQTVIGII